MDAESTTLLVGAHAPRGLQRRELDHRFPGARRVLLGGSAAPESGFEVLRGLERFRLLRDRWERVVAFNDYDRVLAFLSLLRADARFLFDRGELVPLSRRAELTRRLSSHLSKDDETLSGFGNDYRRLQDASLTHLPTVSIIIPIYNRSEALARTLAGLVHQDYPKDRFEVIVSDDGSQEDITAVWSRFRDRLDVRGLWQEDLGFRAALARNRAIDDARGEIVCCLDSDMIPRPDWLRRMTRWFASDAEVVVLGERRFVDADGVAPQALLEDPNKLMTLPVAPGPEGARGTRPGLDWRHGVANPIERWYRHPQPYRLGVSANLAVRRTLLGRAGGFDPAFSAWGGEDVELTYRLVRHGAYVVYDADAIAYHQEHESAVMREEDRRLTQALLGARVPAFRDATPDPPYYPELSLVVEDTQDLDDWVRAVGFVDLEVLSRGGPARSKFPLVSPLPAEADDAAILYACQGEYVAFLAGLPAPTAPLAAACRRLRGDGDLSGVHLEDGPTGGFAVLRVRDCYRFIDRRAPGESLADRVCRLGRMTELDR